jgi:hypothetical protein
MIEVYALVALALIIAGAVVATLVMMAVGIHREERNRSVTVPTSDRVARRTRKFNGFYARIPGVVQEAIKEAEAVTR